MTSQDAKRDWRIAEQDRAKVAELAQALNLPRLVAHLLTLRGVDTVEEGRRFLEPSADHLSDPFSLTDMRPAVERLQAARDRNEQVLVFGDYDVDGISGAAILVSAFRRFGIERCSYGMPDRLVEGYGLSPERVEAAAQQGVTLIVTVDNGVAAHDAAEEAKALGVDLIVTDHHELDEALPEALAVINPKRESPEHPAAHACGVAVAFKLASALTGETADFDLVALGTVADIVPLRGENRALVALGLKHAAEKPRLGLLKLAQVAKVRPETLKASEIAFQIGPRINAGGRVGNGLVGLELLLMSGEKDTSAVEAGDMAAELDAANAERREIEDQILEEALAMLEKDFDPHQRSIVLASDQWHPGVVGIVASRLQRHYYRPVVLIAINGDGEGRGSARSIDDFDIGQALTSCREHLVKCGGHRAAAGLTIESDKVPAFKEAFEAEAVKALPAGELLHRLDIAALVSLSQIDSRLVQTLERLQPFGFGNPAPVFCTYGAEVASNSLRELRGGHLRLTLKDGPTNFAAIGFRMADRLDEIAAAGSVDIAFTPSFNTWRGETSIQLVLKDVRPCAD